MIKVFFLIFEPAVAWDKVALARRGYAFILATYLVPSLLLVTFLEGFGLQHWGKWQPKFELVKTFTPREVEVFETCQLLVWIVTILVCSLLILRVSQTFHERNKYLQAFTLTAYGLSPMLLLRLLDVFPGMNPFVTWGVGVGLTVWILYQGIPRVLQPDPTHAFGLYLSATMVIVLTTGLARLITAMYLLGYMDFEHSWLTRELSRFMTH